MFKYNKCDVWQNYDQNNYKKKIYIYNNENYRNKENCRM